MRQLFAFFSQITAKSHKNGITGAGFYRVLRQFLFSGRQMLCRFTSAIASLRNTNTREDNFNPDFTGDSTISLNEEWLKRRRTWFNQDNLPNNDDEGKVIIDNEAPTADNFKPQLPAPNDGSKFKSVTGLSIIVDFWQYSWCFISECFTS